MRKRGTSRRPMTIILSVCLSGTLVYCMNLHRNCHDTIIFQSVAYSSHVILVSRVHPVIVNPRGQFNPQRGRYSIKYTWVRKCPIFD